MTKFSNIKIFFLLATFFMLPHFAFAADKLLQQSDLQYLGSFRVPQGNVGTSSFEASGWQGGGPQIGFRPSDGTNGPNGSLYMNGNLNQNQIAEIEIPTLSTSTTLAGLNTAQVLIPFVDNLTTDSSNNYEGNLQGLNNIAWLGENGCTGGTCTGGRCVGGTYDGQSCSSGTLPCDANGGQTNISPRSTLGGPCGTPIQIGGIMFYNNKLYATAFDTYDASSPPYQYYSHFILDPGLTTFSGYFRGMIGGSATVATGEDISHFISGWMAPIPSEWQSALGGTAITGKGNNSIISNTSNGPSAFSFDPSDLTNINTQFNINPLLYYPQEHQMIADEMSANDVMTGSTNVQNVVFPPGSSSVIFFGQLGAGQYCYGYGSNNINYATTPGCQDPNAVWDPSYHDCVLNVPQSQCSGETTYGSGLSWSPYYNNGQGICADDPAICYNPDGGNGKGDYNWPYSYQAWVYDANDLAAAKTGTYIVTTADHSACRFKDGNSSTCLAVGQTVKPWNVMPYALWNMNSMMPFSPPTSGPGSGLGSWRMGGAAYDSTNNILYIAQGFEFGTDTNDSYPVISAFKVNTSSSSDTTPPAAPSGLSVM